MHLLEDRATRLFVLLAAFFCANAVLAEFIGVKIFALEATLGLAPLHWNLLGQSGSLDFTAGTVIWPIVFIMTDTVNEYFGKRGVRMISWLAAALVAYGFLFAWIAIHLAPASWWVGAAQAQGVPDYQAAYAAISVKACGSSLARWWRFWSASWSMSMSSTTFADAPANATPGCAPPVRRRYRSCWTASWCCTSPS